MISPWVIGQIRTHTGSMDGAMVMLAALLVACGIAMLIGVKATSARSIAAQ